MSLGSLMRGTNNSGETLRKKVFQNEDSQTEMDFYNAALISVFSCENHFQK